MIENKVKIDFDFPEEITLCDNDACPLENDANSLVMVIGGETAASRFRKFSEYVILKNN